MSTDNKQFAFSAKFFFPLQNGAAPIHDDKIFLVVKCKHLH